MTHKKSKVIVIGGFGFIGYHLVKGLLDWGYHVVVFGHRSDRTRRFFDEMARGFPADLEMIEGEVLGDDLHHVLHDHLDIEGVFHLAAATASTQTLDEYEQGSLIEFNCHMDSIVRDFCTALLAHRTADAKSEPLKLLYVSSGEVYGSLFTTGKPLTEDMHCAFNPYAPGACYPLSKLSGEMALIHGGFVWNWNIVRLQNPYGPLMNEKTLIPKLMKACADAFAEGKGLFDLERGNDTRPYMYVDDAVSGIIDAYESGKTNQIYNICGPSVPLADLVRKASKLFTNDRLLVTVNRGFLGDHRHMDTSKAKKDIAWFVVHPLEDGLKLTYDFYIKHATVERAMKKIGL